MQNSDRLMRAGPFVLVLAATLWLWSVSNGFAIDTRLDRVGPDLWPKIVLGLMGLASLWGIADALLGTRRQGGPDETANILISEASRKAGHAEDVALVSDADGQPVRYGSLYAFGGMAAMLGYVLVIPFLGYTVSTFLILFSIMLLAGYTKPLSAALIAVIGALIFFFIFQRVAYVSLPLGAGPFKELSTGLMALMGVR